MVSFPHRVDPEIHSLRLPAADGLALAMDVRGPADGPAVLFAHGFGQTRHAWDASAAALAATGYRCWTLDARGHGDSGWSPDGRYALEQFATDLVTVARATGGLPVLVGASMGGLLGLAAEAERAPLFRALVLVDITPRWEAEGVERMLAFMRAHPQGFADLEQAAAAIAAYLPHRRTRRSPEHLRRLLVDHGDGRLRWHWDPRLLDEIPAEGARRQASLAEAARRVRVPVLLLSGAESDVVSAGTIAEFLALVPQARHIVVPRARHMVAGDENAVFTRHMLDFLEELPL